MNHIFHRRTATKAAAQASSSSSQSKIFIKSSSTASKDLSNDMEDIEEPYLYENTSTVPAPPCTDTLLSYKQNVLAQVSLTSEEDKVRQAVQHQASQDLIFEDIDDDMDFGRITSISTLKQEGWSSNPGLDNTSTTIGSELAKKLKDVIFGGKFVPQGWIGQGFEFSETIPFGLVQKKGGPCGVLAAIQALLLRNLMFGSTYFNNPIKNIMKLDSPIVSEKIDSHRTPALVAALTEVLWRCSQGSRPIVCLGTAMTTLNSLEDLKEFITCNIRRFDCLNVVYSAVLSRGIEKIHTDMDFPNSPLLGQHGYCTQELVNLIIIGTATSNSFDNEVLLGEKVLRGITKKADIGLLSLFEHYDSCRVGSFLKDPKYPLWLICSESHFSLLFSDEMGPRTSKFDLYYYDGLALQESIIRLTIINKGLTSAKKVASSSEDLIPPLEKCIRTKWENAMVDWNESEPIL